MYNLENIFIPTFSPVISILIFLGIHSLGIIIFNITKIGKIISTVSDTRFQCSLIGIISLTFLIYPFVILNFFNLIIIKIISYSLIVMGIFFFLSNLKYIYFKNKLSWQSILLIIIIFGYFIISLSPNTNADSLDYHLGLPIYILNNQSYPELKFWMHLPKSGSGEIFYLIGLINHAEQLPALTQFSAILSLVGIILKKINFSHEKRNIFLALIAISCPVIIFFITSAKVQLVYVASSTLLFTLVFFGKEKNLINKDFIFLFNLLLITAITAKFSFALSSFLLWIIGFYIFYKNKISLKYLFISLIVFSYLFIPRTIYRIELYDFTFINSLLAPLPTHLYGYQQLYISLTSCGYNGCFPYWLVFPKNLGTFSESLGIGSLAILLINFKKDKKLLLILSIIILQIFISHIFGPNNARWYIEPFMWSIITIKFYGFNSKFLENIFYKIGFAQSLIILLPLIYGIFSFTPGSFSKYYNDKVLAKNADGYELFKWVNKNLKEDDILISTHRSFSLGKNRVLPGDLFLYTDLNNIENKIYYNEIKQLKPNLILFYDKKNNYEAIKNCIGELVYFKKNVGQKGSRNPFNRTKEKYDGYIFEFKYRDLPDCAFR